MRRVAIIGTGMTKFGSLWNKSFLDLGLEAANKAIDDAKLTAKDIQSLYVATMAPGLFVGQEHSASLFSGALGLNNVAATRVEGACASGGIALRQAYIDVASGNSDIVLVLGVEKMTDVTVSEATDALATASSYENEGWFGATFPALYAMIAKAHMHKYGTTEEQLAMCAVKNHKNAMYSEHSQFKKEITISDVMKSAKVADPLKLLDCSPITDGAAAVIIASEEKAKNLCKEPIWIIASAQASDHISLHDREDITTLKATVVAGKKAFAQAKLTPKDIGLLKVHDCFTIAEICAIEDLGFCKKGDGGKFVEQGHTELNSTITVNSAGGLKAKGHPIGATGIAQAIEATMQLRANAGKRQVKNLKYAMTHNVGGSGGTAVVHIFSR